MNELFERLEKTIISWRNRNLDTSDLIEEVEQEIDNTDEDELLQELLTKKFREYNKDNLDESEVYDLVYDDVRAMVLNLED